MTDDIRARHQRIAWSGTPDTCSECATEWPCDAIRMADERDAKAALVDELARRLDAEITARDAANADAERLAEALRSLIGYAAAYTVPVERDLSDARAALAAHDARSMSDNRTEVYGSAEQTTLEYE